MKRTQKELEERHKERQRQKAAQLEAKKKKHFVRKAKAAVDKAMKKMALEIAKAEGQGWTPGPVIKQTPRSPTIFPRKENENEQETKKETANA